MSSIQDQVRKTGLIHIMLQLFCFWYKSKTQAVVILQLIFWKKLSVKTHSDLKVFGHNGFVDSEWGTGSAYTAANHQSQTLLVNLSNTQSNHNLEMSNEQEKITEHTPYLVWLLTIVLIEKRLSWMQWYHESTYAFYPRISLHNHIRRIITGPTSSFNFMKARFLFQFFMFF